MRSVCLRGLRRLRPSLCHLCSGRLELGLQPAFALLYLLLVLRMCGSELGLQPPFAQLHLLPVLVVPVLKAREPLTPVAPLLAVRNEKTPEEVRLP